MAKLAKRQGFKILDPLGKHCGFESHHPQSLKMKESKIVGNSMNKLMLICAILSFICIANAADIEIDYSSNPANNDTFTFLTEQGNSSKSMNITVLPAYGIGWETIPGVVRGNGDSFNLEVTPGEGTTNVTISLASGFTYNALSQTVVLHDDGIAPDSVSGDGIFSAGPISCQHLWDQTNYLGDTNSPNGIAIKTVGKVDMTDVFGTRSFLVKPSIGILREDIAVSHGILIDPNIKMTNHLINIKQSSNNTQQVLRSLTNNFAMTVQTLYQKLPDSFDFLVFFSSGRMENRVPKSTVNFTAAGHVTVRVNYYGTGYGIFNNTFYGNTEKLLGILLLDAHDRGIYSNNIAHELLHQFGGNLSPDLGLCTNGEYSPRSSVGSLIGGQRWLKTTDNQYILDCQNGRNGAFMASPLDRYLMGLISKEEVSPIMLYSSSEQMPLFRCGEVVVADRIVTIDEIISKQGQRIPGPTAEVKKYRFGFAIESKNRFLNDVETTFYSILANHIVKDIPGEDNPYVGFNWSPISNFFGPEALLVSDLSNGDLDRDGSIDADDFNIFQQCFTASYLAQIPVSCTLNRRRDGTIEADFDVDMDVDLDDFTYLQRYTVN